MKIKFLRPVQGMAYFEGDVAEVPNERASRLVNNGWAVMLPETEGTANNLPEEMPARELLFENGLESVEDVRAAIDTLSDIKGIGKKTVEQIKTFVGQ